MASMESGRSAGGFHVANPQGPWFSTAFAGAVYYLETYGWFILAAVVATSLLMPSFQRLAKNIEDNLTGEEKRKREARLDKQREQVRKKQAEAFEKRVQELEKQRAENPGERDAERERRLEEINERAARLGFQPRGQPRKANGTNARGRPEYNPLMGGDVPRFRTSRPARPRGGA